MPKEDKKCDGIPTENTISKYLHKNLSNESVVIPDSGVKILSRGDLLGAINCLFPELNLKSSHIKLKENFSLFSYSPQELNKIFESGRKYRNRIGKNTKNSTHTLNSLWSETNVTSLKPNSSSLANSTTKNMRRNSSVRKSKAQWKQNTTHVKFAKRYEIVQFEQRYTDFLTKFLETHFPERFIDFKNIECLIQELHNLYNQISKTGKIGPFNPNLPVLNISACDRVGQGIGNSSKDVLKKNSSANPKHIRNKIGRDKSSGNKKNYRRDMVQNSSEISKHKKTTKNFIDDFDDEFGQQIAKNLEELFSCDTFSPRYESKLASDVFFIFQKTSNGNKFQIEERAGQYQAGDETVDMKFDLLELEASLQYEP